jgi:ribosome-associated protein
VKPKGKKKLAGKIKPAPKKKPVVKAKAAVKPKVVAKPKTAPKAKPAVKAVAPITIETPKPKSYTDQSLLSIVMAQLRCKAGHHYINLDGETAIADNMVVARRSNRRVSAIADRWSMLKGGHRHIRVEGMDQCDWVLVDAVDVVVHLSAGSAASTIWKSSRNIPRAPRRIGHAARSSGHWQAEGRAGKR